MKTTFLKIAKRMDGQYKKSIDCNMEKHEHDFFLMYFLPDSKNRRWIDRVIVEYNVAKRFNKQYVDTAVLCLLLAHVIINDKKK